jgi:hypothetical protein
MDFPRRELIPAGGYVASSTTESVGATPVPAFETLAAIGGAEVDDVGIASASCPPNVAQIFALRDRDTRRERQVPRPPRVTAIKTAVSGGARLEQLQRGGD